MSRSRLAFVVGSDQSIHDPDGRAISYRGLIEGFRELGVEVSLVGLSDRPSQRLAQLAGGTLQLAPSPGERRFPTLRQTVADARDLIRWRPGAVAQPDAVDIVFEYRMPNRFIGWRLARRRGALHALFLDEPYWFEPERHSLLRPVIGVLERRRYRSADLVCFRSGPVQKIYEEHFGQAKRAIIQPAAVDLASYRPDPEARARRRRELGLEDDEFVVGMAGFFAPWHGALLVGPLVAALRKAGVPARGLLVGGWSGQEAEGLAAARAAQPEQWEHTVVTGAVPQQEVPGSIDALDVGLMPRSNWYGSPAKLFEYGAMRKPLVAAGTDPAREIIEDGRDGLLIDDESELLATVLSIWRDPEAATERVEAFADRIAREHTWRHRSKAILDALEGS